MMITDANPIPWDQAAVLYVGPPGLIPVERQGDLAHCVRIASAHDHRPPIHDYVRVKVKGFELAGSAEVYRLFDRLPAE